MDFVEVLYYKLVVLSWFALQDFASTKYIVAEKLLSTQKMPQKCSNSRAKKSAHPNNVKKKINFDQTLIH